MSQATQAVITRVEERSREAWDDPARGGVTWHTLFSSDITPTDAMCGGIAELAPGSGKQVPHRHAEAEIYLILEGTGILTIDGQECTVTKGAAVFIPGNAWHDLRNESQETVKLFYVFPTARFSDVVYEFPPGISA